MNAIVTPLGFLSIQPQPPLHTAIGGYTCWDTLILRVQMATLCRCELLLYVECWTNSILSLYLPISMVVPNTAGSESLHFPHDFLEGGKGGKGEWGKGGGGGKGERGRGMWLHYIFSSHFPEIIYLHLSPLEYKFNRRKGWPYSTRYLFFIKGTVSGNEFGFRWHIWLVFCLSRERGQFLKFLGAPMIFLTQKVYFLRLMRVYFGFKMLAANICHSC